MSSYPNGITQELISAAQQLLFAMAYERHVGPIVIDYETEILKRLQLRSDPSFREFGIDKVILDRKETFMLGTADREVFFRETYKARDAARLRVAHPQGCPLSEAVMQRLQAERSLFRAMADHPQLGDFARAADSGMLTMSERQRLVDLTLAVLSPYVGDASQVLRHILDL